MDQMDDIHNIQNQEMPTEQEINYLKKVLTRRFVPMPDVDEAWDGMMRQIGKPKRRTIKMRYMGAAIAIAVALISVLVMVNDGQTGDADADKLLFAAVTTSDNVIVTTSDGDVKVDDQKPLSFSEKPKKSVVESVTVTTPRGKDMALELPDGTKVWLNADTHLTFPSQFVGERREVRLEGEAYFEVRHDKSHPFIVHTEHFATRVLGTSFDVRAYSGSTPCVVLVEGSVSVSSPVARKNTLLKPGELAKLSASGDIGISEIDTYPLTQWREGFFYFNNVEAREILKEIGRWYNVSIIVDSPEKLSRRLHFVAERDSSLRSVMSHLNGLGNLDIELREHTIIVR